MRKVKIVPTFCGYIVRTEPLRDTPGMHGGKITYPCVLPTGHTGGHQADSSPLRQVKIMPDQYETLLDIITPSFEDERGAISNILSGIEIRHIAIITSKKGSIRGHHLHPAQEQYIYMLEGEMISYSLPIGADTLNTQIRSLVLKKGYLSYCAPHIAHAYYALTDCSFLNIDSGTRGNFAEDTVPYKMNIPTL